MTIARITAPNGVQSVRYGLATLYVDSGVFEDDVKVGPPGLDVPDYVGKAIAALDGWTYEGGAPVEDTSALYAASSPSEKVTAGTALGISIAELNDEAIIDAAVTARGLPVASV